MFLSLPAIVRANDDDRSTNTPKILPATPEIESFAEKAMSNCHPPLVLTNLVAGINTNGVYTLVGDLFKNGQTNALIDCHIHHSTDDYGNEISVDNVTLSSWTGDKWKTVGYIDVEPMWIKHYSGREADNDKPFWMLYINSQPIITVASYV